MKTYYVYEHWRLDTNEVFYVGIGTKNENGKYLCKKYPRGYLKSKSRRSEFWRNVYKKCDKNIQIKIVYEDYDIELVRNKEIELIKFYGKRDCNSGSLVNITDGGGGAHGIKWSEESKNKKSRLYTDNNPFKGKKHTQEVKEHLRDINIGKFTGDKNPMFGKKHGSMVKEKLSSVGKERWKKGSLVAPPPQIGANNFFSKTYLAIDHNTGKNYEITGGIKHFCVEHNLSYSFVKKFKNKGKCYLEDENRAREKAKNTVNWEFKTL